MGHSLCINTSPLEKTSEKLGSNSAKHDQEEGKQDHNVEERGKRVQNRLDQFPHARHGVDGPERPEDSDDSDGADVVGSGNLGYPAQDDDCEVELNGERNSLLCSTYPSGKKKASIQIQEL